MSTTLTESHATDAPPHAVPAPQPPDDALPLEDRLPEWFRTPRSVPGFAVALGLIFIAFSLQKLWHTDLWGHLAYGRLAWATRSLPATEPLMPLSQGVSFVDTAWLSQLIGYGFLEKWGTAGLRFLYAAPITLCCGLLLRRIYSRTGHALITLIGVAAFLLASHQQNLIVRPQLAGLSCFVGVFFILTRRQWPRWGWVVVPTLFALWANLHGSFVVGLAMLGTFLVGRGIDIVRRSNRGLSLFRDPLVRRYIVLTELAFVATLLNPYGLGLYTEVLSFAGNPNLEGLLEWEPLSLRMKQGQAAAAIAMALVVAYRFSPRRVSASEVLLLGGLGAAALWTSRMIVWWAPVAAYYLALHAHAGWNAALGGRKMPEPVLRRSLWTVLAGGIAFLSFAFTPFGSAAMHGKKGDLKSSVSPLTPLGAADYLRRNPQTGIVYNSYEFGDFLVWSVPDLKVFVTSHAHLVPQEVWTHYRQVSDVSAGWDGTLDLYGINTVVLSWQDQRELIRVMKRSDDWRIGYEDNVAAVLHRRKPL